ARRMPEAGSEVAYTAAVFPEWVSFATGWVVTLAYLVVGPFEAVAIGQFAAYLVPGMNTLALYSVGDQPVYLPHLLLGIGLTVVITLVNLRGVQFSAVFQNWTTFGLLAVFCVFAPLGLWRGNVENWQPYFSKGPSFQEALLSTLAVLPIVPYFMMGFETIPKCAEEAAGNFDPRRFTGLILLSMGVATFFYVVVIAVTALQVPWQDLSPDNLKKAGTDFPPGAIAFERSFGWPWLVHLIIFGAVLSLLKVFNGNFLAVTRMLYAMGRRNLLGWGLGDVSEKHQTPTVAVI